MADRGFATLDADDVVTALVPDAAMPEIAANIAVSAFSAGLLLPMVNAQTGYLLLV
ncbi:hypothetical protein CFter6_1257 [Collimonas fungivorans]|jgi:hypothetical protein|uniref:Uncharacterized protein n=1 Tax=Collimonas fungivorans TaxID=158899 RepID=A0A127P886_9BURK|nr:hypothetical protein CFter6_1257 [Collimonas fungivorans]